MANVRDRIRMSPAEVAAFLGGPHKMQLATINASGVPHLVTMYYALFDGLLGFWTYRASQKARNLERDPRATCLVEAGDGYDQLRGVQIQGTVQRLDDVARIREIGVAVFTRYFEGSPADAGEYLDAQAVKRWGYLLHPTKVASWDHRKLTAIADVT